MTAQEIVNELVGKGREYSWDAGHAIGQIESLVSAAVQAEREACANVAQFEADCLSHEKGTLNPLVAQRGIAKRIAAKIRARGK